MEQQVSTPIGVRKRGRPRAKSPLTPVTAWISPRVHDRLARLAIKHDVSVSSVVRRVIVLALKDESTGPA